MTSSKPTTVRLSDIIAPVFHPVHLKIKSGTAVSYWIKGGRGSLKSSFAAIQIVLGLVADGKANALALRKVGDTVRTSILSTLLWAIEVLKLPHLFTHTVSPAKIIYLPTGQEIICKGLDDPLKLKSLKFKRGYCKFLWFEEAAEFTNIKEMRNVRQTVFRGGPKFVEMVTYNPPEDPYHWINIEDAARAAQEDCYVHESSYLDVPPEWLGEQFIRDAKALEAVNPMAYANEYLGQPVGASESIIFAGKYSVLAFEPKAEWHGPYFGADFGFSQDPATLVKCWVEDLPDGRMNLYVEYAKFETGVELDDMPAMYDEVPGARQHEIMADCSQPQTISHLKRRGFNIKGADKWPESVEEGVRVLQSFVMIYVHPRNPEMIREFRLYSYKIDKLTQRITAHIVDLNNHGVDAIRYAMSPYIKRKAKGFFSS